VQVPEAITIQELGNRMAERAVDIIKFLMKQGQMHKIVWSWPRTGARTGSCGGSKL
jgi:hypothetical protein